MLKPSRARKAGAVFLSLGGQLVENCKVVHNGPARELYFRDRMFWTNSIRSSLPATARAIPCEGQVARGKSLLRTTVPHYHDKENRVSRWMPRLEYVGGGGVSVVSGRHSSVGCGWAVHLATEGIYAKVQV